MLVFHSSVIYFNMTITFLKGTPSSLWTVQHFEGGVPYWLYQAMFAPSRTRARDEGKCESDMESSIQMPYKPIPNSLHLAFVTSSR